MPVGGKNAAMVALNAHGGSLVWRDGDQSASYTPAYPITVDGQRQVVGYMENTVVAHELATGKQLWVHELSKGYDEHAAWPIYHDGHLWIAAPFQVGSEVLKLSGGQGASAVLVRKSELMSNDVASSVLIDEQIYGFDLRETQTKPGRPSRGTFRCIDFHTGEVRWSQGDPKQRRAWPPREDARKTADEENPMPIGHANFLAADGKLILLNDTGELILARATPERYEELGRATILPGEICWTSPALHRGCVFVRNHREAACVYIGRPELQDVVLAAQSSPAPGSWTFDPPSLATLMGIRASDRLSVPTLAQLGRWFAFSFAIIVAAACVAFAVGWRRKSKTISRATLWSCGALAGIVGPLLLHRWLGEFVFTWPVALFALLLATVDQLPLTHGDALAAKSRWRSALVVASFMAACAIYFYVCRQLGLPAQSIFLTGFAIALPLAAIAKGVARRTPLPWFAEFLLIAVGFTVYYWASVGLLVWWTAEN